MARPPIETGNPWIAFVVALVALAATVWFFAGADEAALDRPTMAERLTSIADEHPEDGDLLVVPTDLPAGWGAPAVETARDGDRLERFELRVIRRYEDPDTEGAFRQVRLHVCSARTSDACLADRVVIAERTASGVTTLVVLDDGAFEDDVAAQWADVELTADWQALDWPTRLR